MTLVKTFLFPVQTCPEGGSQTCALRSMREHWTWDGMFRGQRSEVSVAQHKEHTKGGRRGQGEVRTLSACVCVFVCVCVCMSVCVSVCVRVCV